jgi:hypothetical protein
MTQYLIRIADKNRTHGAEIVRNRELAKDRLWALVYAKLSDFGKLDTPAAHSALDSVNGIDDCTVNKFFTISNTGYIAYFERLTQ